MCSHLLDYSLWHPDKHMHTCTGKKIKPGLKTFHRVSEIVARPVGICPSSKDFTGIELQFLSAPELNHSWEWTHWVPMRRLFDDVISCAVASRVAVIPTVIWGLIQRSVTTATGGGTVAASSPETWFNSKSISKGYINDLWQTTIYAATYIMYTDLLVIKYFQ